MPQVILSDKWATIDQYPPNDPRVVEEGVQFTIGDMHANTVKFLYFLARHKALPLPKAAYEEIVRLCNTDNLLLTAHDIRTFNEILDKTPADPKAWLLLLGDETGDRMSNDFFNLQLIKKLARDGVRLEILISNHSAEFIKAYEQQDNFLPSLLCAWHAASLNRLQALIDKGLVTRETILEITDTYYKPVLKALSYTLDTKNNKITISSHAPIGLDNIQCIADKLQVPYVDTTAQDLANTIDAINTAFTRDYVNKNRIHILLDKAEMYKAYCRSPIDGKNFPFVHLIWNRLYSDLVRPAMHNGYSLYFSHGHDNTPEPESHCYNLDNTLGKSQTQNEGRYDILHTQGEIGPKKDMFLSQQNKTPEKKGPSTPSASRILPFVQARKIAANAFSRKPSLWNPVVGFVLIVGLLAKTTLMSMTAALLIGIAAATAIYFIASRVVCQRVHRMQEQEVVQLDPQTLQQDPIYLLGKKASTNWFSYAQSLRSMSRPDDAKWHAGYVDKLIEQNKSKAC